jgi:CP family cyanate transporter-like MFS transporter
MTLAQTSMPVLTRQWFPTRIGLVTAIFSSALMIGETVAVALTGPVLLRRLGPDAWAGTFIAWSVPVAATLGLWLWLAPPSPALRHSVPGPPSHIEPPADSPPVPLSHARSPVSVWHLGILVGSASLMFFTMAAWIPSFDQALGRANATPGALTALNGAQLPVGLGLVVGAQRLAGRRWPLVAAGTLALLAVAGWLWGPPASGPLWAALLGCASAAAFVLGSALPPMLVRPAEVGRLAGGTISLGYSLAFVGPLLGGRLWDATHVPALAFLPVALGGVVLVGLGATLPLVAPHGPLPTAHPAERLLDTTVYP